MGGEPGDDGKGGEEELGVGEMGGEIDDAAEGDVFGDVVEQDEAGAEEGFEQEEAEGPEGSAAEDVAGGKGAESPNDEQDDGGERGAAHDAVGEFDEGFDGGGAGDDDAVAERPVVAASGPGAGGADDGAPEDDEHVIEQDGEGVAAESGRGGDARGGGKAGSHVFQCSAAVRGRAETGRSTMLAWPNNTTALWLGAGITDW